MEEIQLQSGNFFCNDLEFDVLYKDEIYKVHLTKHSLDIVRNSHAFLSNECNIFDYDEGFNYIYNNIVYWVQSQQYFSLNFLKLNFELEEVGFRQIMSESNRTFLQILRDKDYNYTAAKQHKIEEDFIEPASE